MHNDNRIPRVGIIIPLRAKCNSRNWDETSFALKRTLDSIAWQTSREFDCILVGHEPPTFSVKTYEPHNVIFEAVVDRVANCFLNFHCARERQKAIDFDKNDKLLRGLRKLKSSGTYYSHYFALDADDLISRSFVEYVLSSSMNHGGVLQVGYAWDTVSDKIWLRKDLDRVCGSTSVLTNKQIPELIEDTAWFRTAHSNMRRFFCDEVGDDYEPILEPLVCYVHHEDNSSFRYVNMRHNFFIRCLHQVKRSLIRVRRRGTFQKNFPSVDGGLRRDT